MELDNLIKSIKKKFLQLKIFDSSSENKIVIGLSGGADSILLYYILEKLSKEFNLKIFPVHINHLIRDVSTVESEKLSRYIKNSFNQRLFVISANVLELAKTKKITIEEAGRLVRYFTLNNIAKAVEAKYIVLGHNLDDNAETVIFRICRGTGVYGLRAMDLLEGNLIRPLIDVGKNEILEIVKKIGLFYIEDESNLNLDYSRNLIRHKVIPQLTDINVKALRHICDLSKDAREISSFINKEVNRLIKSGVIYRDDEIVISKIFNQLDSYIFREYLKGLYGIFKGDTQKIKRCQLEQFLDLLKDKSSFSINFPHDIVFERGFDFLLIRKKNFKLTFIPQKIEGKEILIDSKIGTLKIDGNIKHLKEDIIVRPFEDRDIYKGRKLKDFFIERRVPKFLRKFIPLIALEKSILFIPLFDSINYTLSVDGRTFKLNFKEKPLYSKIYKLFKSKL